MDFETIIKCKQATLKQNLMKELSKLGYKPVNKNGFLYAKGTIPAMLVAHMDTIHREPVQDICYSKDKNIIMSPQGIGGDDRCGIYAILEIIKEHKCHVLFTEDEEKGCIGARKFTKSGIKPKINYIIEIDRAGDNDAVYYDCDNKEFETFITNFGFKTSMGSFTDISDIAPYLKVAAVNLSSGYYNAHTQHEYIVMSELKHNIARIKSILKETSVKYKYVERIYESFNKYIGDKYYRYGDYGNQPYKRDDCSLWDVQGQWNNMQKQEFNSEVDVMDEEVFLDSCGIIEANSVFERGGFVLFNGEIYEGDDYYIGEDDFIYTEDESGIAFAVDNAIAINESGIKMFFNEQNEIYELFTC